MSPFSFGFGAWSRIYGGSALGLGDRAYDGPLGIVVAMIEAVRRPRAANTAVMSDLRQWYRRRTFDLAWVVGS
jgi:hypothetical protein